MVTYEDTFPDTFPESFAAEIAVAFVGTPTTFATPNTTANGSIVGSLPVGLVEGDLLTCALSLTIGTTIGLDATVTGPAEGWTQIGSGSWKSGTPSNRMSVWWRVVTTGEVANPTWTFSTANVNAVGTIRAIRGINYTTPVHGHSFLANAAAGSTTRTTNALVTTVPTLVESLFSDRSGSSLTLPETERGKRFNSSASSIARQDTNGEVAAGTYTKTASGGVSTSVWNSAIIAWLPGGPPLAIPGGWQLGSIAM